MRLGPKLSTITWRPRCIKYCRRTVKVKTNSLYHRPKRSSNKIRILQTKFEFGKQTNLTSLVVSTDALAILWLRSLWVAVCYVRNSQAVYQALKVKLKSTAICPNKSLLACFQWSHVKSVGLHQHLSLLCGLRLATAALACDSLLWLIWIVTMV